MESNHWTEQALVNMIEIYLGLDYKGMWGVKNSTTKSHIKTAEDLLVVLANTGKNHLRVKVLESYCLMARAVLLKEEKDVANDKDVANNDINVAVENLIEVLDSNAVSSCLPI